MAHSVEVWDLLDRVAVDAREIVGFLGGIRLDGTLVRKPPSVVLLRCCELKGADDDGRRRGGMESDWGPMSDDETCELEPAGGFERAADVVDFVETAGDAGARTEEEVDVISKVDTPEGEIRYVGCTVGAEAIGMVVLNKPSCLWLMA